MITVIYENSPQHYRVMGAVVSNIVKPTVGAVQIGANKDTVAITFGPRREKPVFLIADGERLKPTLPATETNWNIKILLEVSLDIILCNKRKTKD